MNSDVYSSVSAMRFYTTTNKPSEMILLLSEVTELLVPAICIQIQDARCWALSESDDTMYGRPRELQEYIYDPRKEKNEIDREHVLDYA